MSRVVVFQTAYLGDVVLTIPLLTALKRLDPDGSLDVVTTPGGAGLLAGADAVDRVHVYDKRGSRFGLRGLRTLSAGLRSEPFDIGIAAQRSMRTGLLLRVTRPGRIIGFAGAAGAFAYDETVSWNGEHHATRRYLELSAPIGGDPDAADAVPRLVVRVDATRAIESLLVEAGVDPEEPVVVIAPGSAWATKRWPDDRYGKVAYGIVERGYRPVVIGSMHEAEVCAAVAHVGGPTVVDLCGRLDIGLVAAVAKRAVAVIGNDSAPVHVAAAVGTTVVAVFGPTVPAMGYVPRGAAVRIVEQPQLSCRPCGRHGSRRCPLGHFRCMRDIQPAMVLEALDRQVVRPG